MAGNVRKINPVRAARKTALLESLHTGLAVHTNAVKRFEENPNARGKQLHDSSFEIIGKPKIVVLAGEKGAILSNEQIDKRLLTPNQKKRLKKDLGKLLENRRFIEEELKSGKLKPRDIFEALINGRGCAQWQIGQQLAGENAGFLLRKSIVEKGKIVVSVANPSLSHGLNPFGITLVVDAKTMDVLSKEDNLEAISLIGGGQTQGIE